MQSRVLVAIPANNIGCSNPSLLKVAHNRCQDADSLGAQDRAVAPACFSGAKSSSFGDFSKNFIADSGEHGYQTGGCLALGNEGIDDIHYVTWYLLLAGDHDDLSIWPKALYLQRDLMPIDLGHMVVDDHGSNSAVCGDL